MSVVCSLGSAAQALAEEPPTPALTAITVERTQKGVRVHLASEGAPPVVHDYAFSQTATILLDVDGAWWSALPLDTPLEDEWVQGAQIFRDPTAPGASAPEGWYPIDLIALRTDRPRTHWVVTVASEVIIDVGQPLEGAPAPAEPLEGQSAATPAELGVTEEELRGMLAVPSIPSLPQSPAPPAGISSIDAAQELREFNKE